MTTPTVSICLPNLNSRDFLEERIETILRQSFTDWELIISDNYSADGAWEYFQALVGSDSRINAAQAPREGMYANWNNCIRQTRGKYVYIATSDDGMPTDCIEKLVAALEANPTCDLAHCPLRVVDEWGEERDIGWKESTFGRSAPELLDCPHIRLAPFDGLLHLLRWSVYFSITQLLIRRDLFDRVGLFESRWGSMGDFNWNMRASLVANTVHVPDTWGGWRTHSGSASSANIGDCPQYQAKIDQMIAHAFQASAGVFSRRTLRKMQGIWADYFTEKRRWSEAVQRQTSRTRRFLCHLNSLTRRHRPAWDYAFWKLGLSRAWEMNPIEIVKLWTRRCGTPKPLIPLVAASSKPSD